MKNNFYGLAYTGEYFGSEHQHLYFDTSPDNPIGCMEVVRIRPRAIHRRLDEEWKLLPSKPLPVQFGLGAWLSGGIG